MTPKVLVYIESFPITKSDKVLKMRLEVVFPDFTKFQVLFFVFVCLAEEVRCSVWQKSGRVTKY